MQKANHPKRFAKPVEIAINVLKNLDKYAFLVETVKKEIENIKSTATLSEKYKKAYEVLVKSLTEEDLAEIKKALN